MIGFIEGKIVAKRKGGLLVEANNIGYIVRTTEDNLSNFSDGSRVTLWTYLAVRENALDLYGFIKEEELNIFEMLITVSGIGPKSALSIINSAGIKTISGAISTGDASRLSSSTGVGKKTAEKIVVELGGKLIHSKESGDAVKEDMDILEALKSLGYRDREIQNQLKNIPKEISGANEKIKWILKMIGKN